MYVDSFSPGWPTTTRVDQASASVPLLIIPQMLFAGAIIPTAVMPTAVKGLTYLAFSRWGMAGIGSAK